MSYTYRPFEQTYSCGGFASYYGPCGAEDCSSCFPGGNSEQTTERDLSDWDYEFDPSQVRWSKLVSIRTHVARKDHRDGRVKAGQRYHKWTYRYVDDETGRSWLSHSKQVEVAA